MITVPVELGAWSYDVVVGRGARSALVGLIPPAAKRVAVVTQEGIPLVDDLDLGERAVHRLTIGCGEAHKNLATVEQLCRRFAEIELSRADVILGVGGGMVTDVAGFAASAWHRGVAVVHVSTTLLGMVDAAIGGKTGVNLPEGKNLVGAFWQPAGVICDLDALETLPAREVRCGNGEMAKYHFLTGDDLLALDEEARIARCVAIKAAFVAADEREEGGMAGGSAGGRALLNYGHTLAHALETATDHSLAHGEAVAVGLRYAAHLAAELGRIDDARVRYHREVVEVAYGLSTALPAGVDPDRLVALMARDKKAVSGLTFVLDGPHGVELVPGVPADAARRALTALAAP